MRDRAYSSPVAHPPSHSMTSPSPSVTVMITDLLLMRPPPEIGVRWVKQARHTSQMDRVRMRGEERAVEAPARSSGRDGVMASPPPPRRRWLLESAGAAFQHVLTGSTVTYDQAEHCPIRLRAWAESQAIGGVALEVISSALVLYFHHFPYTARSMSSDIASPSRIRRGAWLPRRVTRRERSMTASGPTDVHKHMYDLQPSSNYKRTPRSVRTRT